MILNKLRLLMLFSVTVFFMTKDTFQEAMFLCFPPCETNFIKNFDEWKTIPDYRTWSHNILSQLYNNSTLFVLKYN